jgi:hypothetical protein
MLYRGTRPGISTTDTAPRAFTAGCHIRDGSHWTPAGAHACHEMCTACATYPAALGSELTLAGLLLFATSAPGPRRQHMRLRFSLLAVRSHNAGSKWAFSWLCAAKGLHHWPTCACSLASCGQVSEGGQRPDLGFGRRSLGVNRNVRHKVTTEKCRYSLHGGFCSIVSHDAYCHRVTSSSLRRFSGAFPVTKTCSVQAYNAVMVHQHCFQSVCGEVRRHVAPENLDPVS